MFSAAMSKMVKKSDEHTQTHTYIHTFKQPSNQLTLVLLGYLVN